VHRHRISLAFAAAVVVTACGSTSNPGNGVATTAASSSQTLPTPTFVRNSSCVTDGSSGAYSPSPPSVNGQPPVGQAIDEMPHTHVPQGTAVMYNHDPPTSGCHFNLGYGTAPIQAGAYDQMIQPEYWVHNLEHGYTVVLYNCPSGCSSQFQQLRTWYKGLAKDPTGVVPYAKVIIIPWSSMTVPFAAVSWDWYDPIPNFSIAEVQRFYANHVGHGPETRGA